MTTKWNFKNTFGPAAITAFLAISSWQALATPVLVHDSREDYFSGGTMVTGCTGEGCTSLNFNFGTPTGPSLWEVVEKVFFDSTANTTEFTYTVFNDTLASSTSNPAAPLPGSGIASFDIKNSGFSGVMNFPVGWTPTNTGTSWHWVTSAVGSDIRPGTSLGCNIPGSPTGFCFSVLLAGNIPVGFNTTFVDLGLVSHTNQTDANWMVSAPIPIPEPEAYAMMGIGLALMGFVARRRKGQDHAA